jgi:hypothetical protein
MSTRINIAVDNGGLLNRNAQQTSANRQAKLESDRTLRLSAEAVDARIAAQAAKGLSIEGQPLYGNNASRTRRIDQEPAAFRSGYGALLAGPFVYSDYGGSHSGLTVRCRGNRNVFASRFNYEENKAFPEGITVSGPTANTIALEPAPVPDQPEAVFYFGQRQDNNEFLGWAYLDELSANLPNCTCRYAVQNAPYNTILNWQRGEFTIPPPPYNVVSLAGNLEPASGFRPLVRTGSFTHEFIMRMPAGQFDESPSPTYLTANAQPIRSSGVFSAFGGISITMFARDLWDTTDLFLISLTEPFVNPNLFIYEVRRTSAFAPRCTIFAPNFTLNDVSVQTTFELPEITPGSFVHCALTRYPVGAAYRWNFFVNGLPLMTGIVEPDDWESTYGTQPPSVATTAFSNRNRYASTVLPLPAIHASRFTPRVLYSGAFTPPVSITSFA